MCDSERMMLKNITNKITEIVSAHNRKTGDYDPEDPVEDLDIITFDPSLPIAPLLCEGLKSFMKNIITQMGIRKKSMTGALVNKEKNPKDPRHVVPRKVVYESNIFSAKNLFDLLQDKQKLIPRQRIYNLFIERILSCKSVKLSLKKKEDDEEQRS